MAGGIPCGQVAEHNGGSGALLLATLDYTASPDFALAPCGSPNQRGSGTGWTLLPAGVGSRAMVWHAARVRLVSSDRASVDLEISAYEFPERQARGPQDWDANWLVVRGEIVLADGTGWSFREPCLTTWDAERLGAWLEKAAAGEIAPSLEDDEDGLVLVFLEPNLGFSVESRTAGMIRLRVHLSLESLPPWLRNAEDRPDHHAYCVLLDMLAADLASSADRWLRETKRYPPR